MTEDDAGPSAALSPLAPARLDDLLGEVLTRVGDVLDTQERLRGLLDAVVGINADLSLERALERIVTCRRATWSVPATARSACWVLGRDAG